MTLQYPGHLALDYNIRGEQRFLSESNKQTGNTEAFADDSNIFTLADRHSLRAIKNTLASFASFSSLKCNLEKSQIMPIGTTAPDDPTLLESGFTISDSVQVLGFNVSTHLETLTSGHENTIQKIGKIVNFWNRFGLSLPGRINIAKSLLLLQINYIGCIIMPTPVQLASLNKIIEDFVVSRISVAKSKVYLPVNLGGLGLIRLDELLKAQQVKWFKRAHTSCRDNWRVNLKNLCHGNCLLVNYEEIPNNRHPILRGIAAHLLMNTTS